MRQQKIATLDSARTFGTQELFFSTTDHKGIIESGNGVFARIAGYDLADLVGKPHSIIRHPDMPRAVFQLFWTYLLAGRTVAAYVKNLAQDGRYYWVVALVIPIGNRYLSVRFKPNSPVQAVVAQVYGEMCRIEAEAAAADETGAAGMAAAAAYLQTALASLGFADYDAFMRTILREELKSRDAILTRENTLAVPPLPDGQGRSAEDRAALESVRSIYEGCQQAYQHLCRIFDRLDAFVALNEQLGLKSTSVLELTRAFRFISLNTAVKSARLGQQGAGLGVIAGYLGDSSADVAKIVTGLTARIGTTSSRLAAVIFDLAGARLQTEMILVFCHELATDLLAAAAGAGVRDPGRQRAMIDDLKEAFVRTIGTTVEALRSFGQELGGLSSTSNELQKIMLTLEFTQLGGMVEAYRLDQVATFGVIFTEVRKQLDETKAELVELTEITDKLRGLAVEAPRIATVLGQAENSLEKEIARI
jgi:PAS domain S-box-containing protein